MRRPLFTDEVLALKLRGKNVNDVLSLSVQEALEYFVEKPVPAMLRTLQDVGLGYLAGVAVEHALRR